MSYAASRRLVGSFDAPSTSGRTEDVRRALGSRPVHRTAGTLVLPVLPSLQAPARAMVCEASRPPAGPSTILCSSLGKERKKLAKVLKSHRKVLEKRLSALTRAEADAPVLSELLSELRVLTTRLESQRAVALLQRADDSDSSDSDDDECDTRSAAALCSRRRSSAAAAAMSAPAMPTGCTVVAEPTATASVGFANPSTSSTMVVSTLTGEIELPVPAPQEGWAWDEEDFRAAKFDGIGGRVMVCTGSKCQRKGATEVLRAVSALSDGNPNIEVVPCKCVGKCSAGAALRVRPLGQACATYTEVRPGQLREVFAEHFAAPTPAPAAGGQEDAARSPTCCEECQECQP